MARLKHAVSGVVVEVADEKVERLGSEWSGTDDETQKRSSRSRKSES